MNNSRYIAQRLALRPGPADCICRVRRICLVSIFWNIQHHRRPDPSGSSRRGRASNLSGPGEYTIFYENNSYFDGVLYETSEKMPGLQIEVVEKASGLKLQTYPSPSSSSYSVGGRSGHSVMAFRAEAAGLHVINASYPSEPGPKVSWQSESVSWRICLV